MNKRYILGIALLSLVFSGCTSMKSLKPITPLSSIPCGCLQYPDPGGMVFRDAAIWQSFWNKYCMAMDEKGNKLAAPQIDFSTQVLVGIFSGQKPTGGYSINIERILEGPKTLVVEYYEKSPPPGAMVIMVITYPCEILAIPRSDKAVEFKAIKKK